MTEENKAIVRRFFAAIDKQDIPTISSVWASDLVWHGRPPIGTVKGIEAFKKVFGSYLTAFPDMTAKIEELVAEGDRVVARWSVSGTNKGAFGGIPATGKRVTFSGMSLYRIAKGKIAEEWFNEDDLGLMTQLGAIPSP